VTTETPGPAEEMTLRARIDLLMRQWESNASRHSGLRPEERAVADRYATDLRAVLAADHAAQQPPAGPEPADTDALRNLVRDMLQSFPDTADEPEWRDRAGALHVCDPGGQPYRAQTEEDE
jgi:hypothetical protein